MPAAPRPGDERTGYDRWTFERWSDRHARQQRQARRRWGRATLCAGAVLLVVGGWAWRHPRTPDVSRLLGGGPGALAGVTVILDPGHGGEDSGAAAVWGRQRVAEAALTYRTALEVAQVLRAQGAEVRYTVHSRTLADGWDRASPTPGLPTDAVLAATDRPLRRRVGRSPRQLWQRADVARQVWASAARADPRAAQDVFFLSLHYDAIRDADIHGGVVCVDPRAGPPPPFALALARLLAAHGWGRATVADGQPGLSDRELGVLNPRYNPVPQKALLEVATLSNYDDSLSARDPAWRGQVALAVAQAIVVAHEAR